MVEEFDREKRREQRAMQNLELEELLNKKVKFLFVDEQGEEFSEKKIKE
jgi:hypothetical protein